MEKEFIKANVDRFSKGAKKYNSSRPTPPKEIVDIAIKYLGYKPNIVIDLGCGTGLSTKIWANFSNKVIGVEPGSEMRTEAIMHINSNNTTFVEGISSDMPFGDNEVDIVACSQSFHWMEPKSTLKESSRVLKNGGLFLAFDCDWPPTIDYIIEKEFLNVIKKSNAILDTKENIDENAKKFRKSDHLKHIKNSGEFTFVKEIVLHSKENYNKERFIDLLLSQGGVQTVLNKYPEEIKDDIESFKNSVSSKFIEKEMEIIFSYRIRLGIK
ncbi:MAG: class I SAM-dependent methyltransferase [Clostridium sp.]